jgi:hypothetical protein
MDAKRIGTGTGRILGVDGPVDEECVEQHDASDS